MDTSLSGLSTFFSWLVDYTIEISILICLIFIIKSIATKKLPAWWHYSLWIILLLRMIIPWKFENPLNISNVVPISIDESLFESVLIEEQFITAKFTPELSSSPQGWHVQVNDVLLILWITCAIIFGMYILVKNIKFRNAIKKEPLLTEKRVLYLLEKCKRRMKIRAPLKITITDKIKSPALFGYIRPRLLLPVGVPEKLNDAELSYMFMHELGHLKRHDIGVSWIIAFLQVFQWFNPLVWLAFHHMRIDQESACDASVLSRIKRNHTIDYAGTIVGFLENFCRNRKLPALVGILENQTQIKKRITMIVNYRKYSKTMAFFSTALLVIVGFILFSFADITKENNELSELDSATLQVIPFETEKDSVVQDNGISYEMEVAGEIESTQKTSVAARERIVADETGKGKGNLQTQVLIEAQNDSIKDKKEAAKEIESTQKASMASAQDRVVADETGQRKANLQTQVLIEAQNDSIKDKKRAEREIESTQKASIASTQDRVVADEIEQGKTKLQTQKITADIQDNNIETGEVRLVENNRKTPAEVLKMFKKVYNISPENKDNLKPYSFAVNESTKSTKATSLPEKTNINNKKNIKYLGLANSVYFMSGSLANAKGTQDLSKSKTKADEIDNLKDFDEKPKIVSKGPLRYPRRAQNNGIEGRVFLRFTVDKDGNVRDPQVVSAEPEGVFEQAALDSIVKYKLTPAKKDGKCVSSIVRLPIVFNIPDDYMKLAQR